MQNILIGLIFFTLLGSCNETNKKSITDIKSQKIVEAIQSRSGELLESYFTKDLLVKLNAKTIFAFISQKEELFGKLGKITAYTVTKEFISYEMFFENSVLPIKMSFNSDEKLTTIWFGSHIPFDKDSISLKSFDGYKMNLKIEGTGEASEAVVIMIHDSGLSNLNGAKPINSSPRDGFFFKMSDMLTKNNITSVRYNKRSTDLNYLNELGEEIDKFTTNSKNFEFYIKDVKRIIKYIKQNFKGKKIYLLGHGQGADIALQIAQKNKNIKGVVLIGYSGLPLVTKEYQRRVVELGMLFDFLDKNNDFVLSEDELNDDMKKKKVLYDIDGNKFVTKSEFDGVNTIKYYNQLAHSHIRSISAEQLNFNSNQEILEKAKFDILFAHGDLDRQSPSSVVKSIYNLNQHFWKKKNLIFMLFNQHGHNLQPKKNLFQGSEAIPATKTLKEVVVKLLHQIRA